MFTERLLGAIFTGVADPPDATETVCEWSVAVEEVVDGTSMEWLWFPLEPELKPAISVQWLWFPAPYISNAKVKKLLISLHDQSIPLGVPPQSMCARPVPAPFALLPWLCHPSVELAVDGGSIQWSWLPAVALLKAAGSVVWL